MGRKKLVSDEQLLEAARRAFVEAGMSASTRRIAREAGLSEAALFQRYRTKAELFFAAMVPPAADVEAMFARPHRDTPVRDELLHVLQSMLAYFRQASPVLAQMMVHPAFRFEEFAAAHPAHPLVTIRVRLMDFLETLRLEGRLRDTPAAPVALLLFSAAYSVAVWERMGAHGGHMPDWIVAGMIEPIVRGAAPDPPPAAGPG
jgi:AcrR family transcriptional regulator